MRSLSLQRLGESGGRALRRFPLALASAVVAAVVAMVLVGEGDDQPWQVNLLMTAQLGIPVFIALRLTAERRRQLGLRAPAGVVRAVGAIGGLLLLAVYYRSLPAVAGEAIFLRHVQLNVAAHLAVAVLPYLYRGENNGFWQYNRILLLRFVNAVFFSAVLYGGLAIALLALKELLGIDIGDLVFIRLWIGIAFVFNTWYFVGGIPASLDELDQVSDYAKVIRVFAQYILAPLVIVYLVILTTYLVKVLVTAVWPSGWIGYLVSSVAVAGIFSLLLLYPLSERERARWFAIYARIFHVLIIPAVIMLLMAVGKRIGQYGWTEKRYLLAVAAVWLAGVAVLGLLRGRHYIKIIPATLALIALLTAFGPWGATAVSQRSQLARLDALLTEHGRLAGGRIVSSPQAVPLADRREISAVLSYLIGNHGADVLVDRVDATLQAQLDAVAHEGLSAQYQSSDLVAVVTEYMNVPYVERWRVTEPGWHHFVREPGQRVIPISGFDYSVELDLRRDGSETHRLGDRDYRIAVDRDRAVVTVTRDSVTAVTLPLVPMIEALLTHEEYQDAHTAPPHLLEATARGDSLRVKLSVADVSWRDDDEITLVNLKAMLLVALGD